MNREITIKYVARREVWVNSNAFFCEVKTYHLKRVFFFFKKWVLTDTKGYASLDYFLREKLDRYGDNYIVEVII